MSIHLARTSRRLIVKAADDERHILPAEAKAVADGMADPLFPRRVGNVIQIALGVRHLVIDCRRKRPLTDGHDADNQLYGAGGRNQMAKHAFRAADRHLISAVAEDLLDRQTLDAIIDLGARPMRIDVADIGGRQAAVGERSQKTGDRAAAVRMTVGDSESVSRRAVSRQLGVDGRTPPSGMLVLEELEHARRRGATIYAEVSGYGSTADAFRVTDSHPEGRGAIACIQGALKDSGLDPSDIGYINAHGTSTQVNDRVESLAIKKVFGDGAYLVPVSSSKSMLGHLIAAAGAVELITCVEVLRRGVLPPTINYETPDPDCDLDYVPNSAREKRVRHALSNSFGFGGQNISLIVSRFDS